MQYISSDTNVWIDYRLIGKLELLFRLDMIFLMNCDAIEDELLSPKGIKQELLLLGLEPTELGETEFYDAVRMAEQYPRLS